MNSIIRSCTVVLLSTAVLATSLTSNDTPIDELRRPRVVGRIVKLYSGSKPEPIVCAGDGYQADPVDCAVFYRCIKGGKEKYTVFRFQCGPGTVYDPDTEVCNHPKSTKRSECFSSAQEATSQRDVNNENEIDFNKSQELPSPIKINKPVYAAHNAVKRNDILVTTVKPLKTTAKTLVLNQKPRQPNQQGDACTTDGFMGDSENCRKFYRCVGNGRGSYIRYEFSCSETTIWDDEVQSCNHPGSVKRQRCGRGINKDTDTAQQVADKQNNPDSDFETIQGQPQINYGSKVSNLQAQINNVSVTENQSQMNYGDRLEQSQKQGNYSSDTKPNKKQTIKESVISEPQTQIIHGNNAVHTPLQIDHTKQTSQKQTQASDPDDENDVGYNNNNNSNQDTPQDPQVTESNAGNTNEKQCTSSGFMGDPDNCKKFYRCVDNGKGGYTRYEFTCGDGTVWDASIEGCNHAWAVKKCNENAPADSATTTTGAISAVTTEAPIKTTSRPDTTTQYSTTTKASTTDDDDEDTGYGNQNQASPSTITSAKPTSTIGVTTEETFTSNETVCTHNGFISDESDCKKFYRCVDNGRGSYTKYEFTCGDGTVWDSEIQACNHAWAVEKCGGAENSDFNNEETTTHKASSTNIPVTSRPSSTTETLQTENNEDDNGYGQPVETSPPVTTTETQQTTAPASTSNNKCTSSGFMGDQNDCKKFYRCVDDGNGSYTRYEFTCGEGTVWDQTIESCNHAWAVQRCDNSAETQTLPQNEVTTQKTSSTSSSISGTEDDQEYNPPSASAETSSTAQSSESTENPSKGKECTEEGFFADEDDCRNFYRCVEDGKGGYTKYEFTCGEGTVWDSAIQGCNHPSNENNCRNNSGVTSSTSPANEPDRENDEIYTETTSKATTTSDTSQTSQPATPKEPQTSTGTCESEGFHPNLNDCKKFYRCVDDGNGGYTKYDFACGDGTVWDQNIQGCNHESEYRCKGSSANNNGQQNHETATQPNQETTNQQSSTAETQKPSQGEPSTGSPTSQEPTTTASGDQGQCTSDGFYANPSNCKNFYRCVSDGKGGYTKYDFSCGDGTVWVQEIQACDHDNDVNSCSSQSSVGSTTSSSETTQQATTDDYNQQTSSNPSTSIQSQTPTDKYPTEGPSSSTSTTTSSRQCTSEGFYPNENDCTKFYRCVDNGNGGYTKYDFTCGEGTAWDTNIQACNHQSEVESCNGSSQEKPETQPMQDEPAETQSTTTTTTSSGIGSTTTTSTSGPCTNNSDSEKPPSTDVCTKEGYYGNSQDCTKFYRCVDNGKGGYIKYDYQCGEGTIWDKDITTCNHPNDVNSPSCNNQEPFSDSSSTTSSSQEDPSSTSQSSTQFISSTTESNNQSTSNCSQEDSSKKPGKSQVNCTKAGFYPDPNDCKKFYRCVDWDGNGQRFSVFHFDCGEGTIWDPQLETCNYEDSVYPPRDCSGTDTQSETSQETTTTAESTTTTKESTTTTEQEQTSTTELPMTSEKTTTQQYTTGEQTTTQQSTTSEQTTTEQSTTSEQTTTEQPTTSKQTTTEQSTTTQKTTTEQPTTQQTTTQQTTTQQTTTEQTTTEQTTASEQTTTEPTTISKQTTTEQSTTSEQTTTEQSTTSEQTTTEQSTTSEPTTTEQSTTSEQTTTEQSITTEQTTTQQSTTSEDSTTTQSTNSEETTTQQSTTEQSTSDSSTTQTSTTQQQDSSTTESSTGDQQTTTEQSSSKPDKCPETDDDQYTYVCPTGFRRHPKYCNLFYQCTEDDDTHEVKVATFTCPNNTIYDESKTQCVEESKADKKCDGQIAQKRRVKRLDAYTKEPMVVSKEKHNCPAVGHFPFERQDECSAAFLKCERSMSGKLRGFVYRCPDGFVYWAVSRRCEPESSMRSCKPTAISWSGRWEIPMERRNVAP